MRGKKPLSEKQVKSLRKLVEGNPLHALLLNLSVDLMLRGSDLLNLSRGCLDRIWESEDRGEDSSEEDRKDHSSDAVVKKLHQCHQETHCWKGDG